MTITITGTIPKVRRLVTDLTSFDRAFENQRGDIGFPLGTIVEIFGKHSSGKSTTTYGLSGMIAQHLACNIALLDLEGFDPDFLVDVLENVGYDGEVHCLQGDTDEDVMDLLVSTVGDKKKNYGVGILDSIGAISPIAEAEGDLGEANMGKRAKLLGQFARKATKIIRDYKDAGIQKTFFVINHQLPQLGGKGTYTPGGLAKEYLSGVRIQLSVAYTGSKYEIFPDMSYVLEGEVKKNKSGMKGRKFYLFMLNGKGIHKGLTWMYDAWKLGLVTRGKTVKIGDKSVGYLKDIVMEAHKDNEEFFIPFKTALETLGTEKIQIEDGEESDLIEEANDG